ncbi:TerB N-terminal domain-containing protein [Clostridium estertheticum]|uniref:TerB N-terminal domain-containing protein n=1 Tax=Clostridium estertheticum TaxID=238834 RepID=UPI001CF4EF7A|nr:TerB N-terminal domain-containing protein [Clostridium estertheticum]MCB2353026.1 TerB N-terminal domain-containing protein [Clostridium estertheticum]WAG40322.1 TerB N-terminal domain-containing protein [Clostridium estertheticum]
MRQWDSDTGTEIELCDMKCWRQSLSEISASYLLDPFRMRGQKWVGIKFDDTTEPEVIYRLFDRAVELNNQIGFMITLDNRFMSQQSQYRDTLLSFETKIESKEENIPQKILDMRKLYEHGDGSFRQKSRNFYIQGKFMEDYEDDCPWEGELRCYFPTYHDLRLNQLRGYFTWRTEIRKGNYQRISTSLAYLYLYELENGIGTTSVEDSLRKMKEFEIEYLDSAIGDESMRKNLHRWMLELAILNGVEPDIAYGYADTEMIEKDRALVVLRNPNSYSDQEIFKALCTFYGNKLSTSVVIKKYEAEGIHLFAEVWRLASAQYRKESKSLFKACFGSQRSYRWYPLSNAIYFNEQSPEPITYILNESREYSFKDDVWSEQSYHKLHFNKQKFDGLIHESDRRLRVYLKTGHPLRERSEETWASPYIDAVIEIDKKIKAEAAKPKVSIRFSDLDKIRKDSLETMDSLLTEEDTQDIAVVSVIKKESMEADSSNKVIILPLDDTQIQILMMLLEGKSVKSLILDQHGLPEVIADSLNEALFDEIGDTVVACDFETITLVEDYREDISRMLGGVKR